MHNIYIPQNTAHICKCGCHKKTRIDTDLTCHGCMCSVPCCNLYDATYINDDGTIDLQIFNESLRSYEHSKKSTPFIDGGEYITKKINHDTMYVKEKRRTIK